MKILQKADMPAFLVKILLIIMYICIVYPEANPEIALIKSIRFQNMNLQKHNRCRQKHIFFQQNVVKAPREVAMRQLLPFGLSCLCVAPEERNISKILLDMKKIV